MGQILDRIFRFAKSEINSANTSKAEDYIKKTSKEEELKRIIDELNEKKKEHEQKQKEKPRSDSAAEKMDFEKAYVVLDLKSDATIEDIKASYKKKMKEYHPDRVAGLGEELQELARKKTIEINEAYDFIRKMRNF